MSNYTSNSGIYVILNTKNQKVYIGKTLDFRERWKDHKKMLNGGYHHNRHLQNAWNKYGAKRFKFLRLEYCEAEELDTREKHYIAVYKAKGLVYNLTDGGEGQLGRVVTEETRQKMSKALTGKKLPPLSDEAKQKISSGNLGKVRTPEMRKQMSERRKGIKPAPFTQQHRDRIGAAFKGRKPSPQAIAASIAKHSKRYIITTPDGEEIEIVNLKQFCRDNGLDQSHMWTVANGKAKHHKKWKCRYA